MGPLSRPLTRSGQWYKTTIGISQSAARLKTRNLVDCGSDEAQYNHKAFSCCVKSKPHQESTATARKFFRAVRIAMNPHRAITVNHREILLRTAQDQVDCLLNRISAASRTIRVFHRFTKGFSEQSRWNTSNCLGRIAMCFRVSNDQTNLGLIFRGRYCRFLASSRIPPRRLQRGFARQRAFAHWF